MRKGSLVLLMISVITLTTSCGKDDVVCADRKLRTIQFDFETALTDWVALGGQVEASALSDIEISFDTAYTGSKSVKFTITPQSLINNGNRSELTFDQMIKSGDLTNYAYSIYIPTDYQDVPSLRQQDGTPNWQVLGQWHDQPDECIGQTWDDIAGNSPPVAVYYNYLTKSDQNYLDLLAGSEIRNIHGFDETWDGVSTILLEYDRQPVAIAKIQKGHWYRLAFQIKWSTDENGTIQAWINDEPFTSGMVNGKNMHNNASHYFKFGLYRNPLIPYTNSIYYDDLVIN